jgi:pilus assembly protein Flp/PilA
MLFSAIRMTVEDDGSTAIEYAIIAALISIVTIGALRTIGANISANFFGPISAALGG